jgi:hypothetical protein
MTVEFRIDKEDRIVYGVLKGEVDVSEVLAGLEKVISSDDYEPELDGITDLRAMKWESDQGDLRLLVHFLIENRKRIGKSRSAVVVSGDRTYGMTRMFEVFSEQAPIKVRVFRDFDKAKRWVLEGRPKAG